MEFKEFDGMDSLNAQNIILVKEAWNKSLAWKDQVNEAMYYRWFELQPSARDKIGSFFDTLLEDLFSVIDLAVRSLDPSTEDIQRESYRSVHPRVDGRSLSTIPDYMDFFAHIGLSAECWSALRAAFLFAIENYGYYIEDDEKEDLELAKYADTCGESALWRFFTLHVCRPALEALRRFDELQKSDLISKKVPEYWRSFVTSQETQDVMGEIFYVTLLSDYPELLDYFKDADMDALAGHLAEALSFIVRVAASGEGFDSLRGLLKHLADVHLRNLIPTWSYALVGATMFKTLTGAKPLTEELQQGWLEIYNLTATIIMQPMFVQERIMQQAESWFRVLEKEWGWTPAQFTQRMTQVMVEVGATGSYHHTAEELQYGCQVAWRNSVKSIGRINWNRLLLRDRRHVTSPDEMFQECVEHLNIATKGDNLQCVITMFRPRDAGEMWGDRFWNAQFTSYACYEMEDGSLMGDPATRKLTQYMIEEAGWVPPEPRSPWDVLPLVIEKAGEKPRLYELPESCRFQVPIEHPSGNEAFKKLGLRWSGVPTKCSMALRLGGVDYCCNAINDWPMEMEISRGLWERYDKGKEIAECFGIDTSTTASMWKEASFTELNRAVVHSFLQQKLSVVDHYTASDQFMTHCRREKKCGREVPGQWSWIGGLVGVHCPVWHHEMRDFAVHPQYHDQACKVDCRVKKNALTAANLAHVSGSDISSLGGKMSRTGTPALNDPSEATTEGSTEASDSTKVLILFGSETGTAERFARALAKKIRLLKPTVAELNEYASEEKKKQLTKFTYILVVASTFGKGGPPYNARHFEPVEGNPERGPMPSLTNSYFAVLAVGSSSYPGFCAFGMKLDSLFEKSGAQRMTNVAKADELHGQQSTYSTWEGMLTRRLPMPTPLEHGGDEEHVINRSTFRLICDVTSGPDAAASAGLPPPPVLSAGQGTGPCTIGPEGKVLAPARHGHAHACPIVMAEQLIVGAVDKNASTVKLAIDVSGLYRRYKTGDHISIYPINEIADAQAVAEAVGLQLDDVVTECWERECIDGECVSEPYSATTPVKFPARVLDILSYMVDLRLHEDGLLSLLQLMLEKYDHLNPEPGQLKSAKAEETTGGLDDDGNGDAVAVVAPSIPADNSFARSRTLSRNRSRSRCGTNTSTDLRLAELVQWVEVLSEADHALAKEIGRKALGQKKASARIQQRMAIFEDKQQLMRKLIDKYFTVGALLKDWQDLVQLNMAEVLSVLPAQKPRYYSISSSSAVFPTTVYITVGQVSWNAGADGGGVRRKGLSSGMLNQCKVGDRLLVALHQSSFRLPTDPSAPILMIGPGTGIAPFAAFCEERAYMRDEKQQQLGEAFIYIGFKSKQVQLYASELQAWHDSGVLTDAVIAYSQEPGMPKTYVQDHIAENGEHIAQLLMDPKCHYYVCGSARIADDVYDALIQMMCVHCCMSRVTAGRQVKRMIAEGRYNLDVWGTVQHLKEKVIDARQMLQRRKSSTTWMIKVNEIKAAKMLGDADKLAKLTEEALAEDAVLEKKEKQEKKKKEEKEEVHGHGSDHDHVRHSSALGYAAEKLQHKKMMKMLGVGGMVGQRDSDSDNGDSKQHQHSSSEGAGARRNEGKSPSHAKAEKCVVS